MTPNRGIDAEFLDLPRLALADAALSAATAAGASYADLRIQRIGTEIIHLRDGEPETAILSRELGFAVRVIVNGTWGFASHAELSASAAADTARRAVRVASTLAALNTERVELRTRTGVHRRRMGLQLSDRPVQLAGQREDRGAGGLLGAIVER